MLLSYIVFITISIRFDQSRQFSFIFYVDPSYMIDLVYVLSSFHHRPHLVWLIMIAQFHFWLILYLYDQSHRCSIWFLSQAVSGSIGHNSLVLFLAKTISVQSIISLSSGFQHSWHLVQSILTAQFHFWHRLHLYNRSHRCLVWCSSQTTPSMIDYDSSVSFSM